MPHVHIRPAEPADLPAITAIYDHAVRTGTATFELDPPDLAEITSRYETLKAGDFPYIVAIMEDVVVGYAYAGAWKTRSAFRYCVETAIYVDQGAMGTGVGSALYRELIAGLKARSIHSLIAAITVPNAPSVAFHQKFGFRPVGHFAQVGWKLDRWIDVSYWELIL